MSAAIEKKAARLLEGGRVSRLRDGVYTVHGDNDSYAVTRMGPDSWICSCPSTLKACSHVLAAAGHERLHPAQPVAPAVPAQPAQDACGEHCVIFAGFDDICPRCNGTGVSTPSSGSASSLEEVQR
jgi:hypothetical protein